MAVLLLKLTLTPALIGLATLVGRRWGPAVAGWFVGLPLTSAPVALFLALDQGRAFAARAAIGSLLGAASESAFCLGYVAAAGRGVGAALVAGSAGFILAAAILSLAPATVPPAVLALGVAAILVATLAVLPRVAGRAPSVTPPAWDLPARMVSGVVVVLVVTSVAPAVGPRISGIAAAFPVFASVLTAFAHDVEGRDAALRVLRGLLVGLFAFETFFLVLAGLIEAAGIPIAFALAAAAAVVVQAVSLRAVGTGREVAESEILEGGSAGSARRTAR